MKKCFSFASAWVLALGMGMTSCSNDTDETVTEQQPQERVVYLSATAPDAETRAAVSGSSDSDAIKITGWKQGDELMALYVNPLNSSEYGTVTFTFNESSKKFESTLPTGVEEGYIRLVTQGFDNYAVQRWDENSGSKQISGTVGVSSNSDLEVDLDNHYTNIPLWGSVSVGDDGLEADMNLPGNFSLACIHNVSGDPIQVRMKSGGSYLRKFNVEGRYDIETDDKAFAALPGSLTSDASWAAVMTIEDGEKAYLPFYRDYEIEVDGMIFKEKLGNTFKAGKVYKATYESTAEWVARLQLGKDDANKIVIETNVDVSGYQEDDDHKPLNSKGTLWAVLEGTELYEKTLRIQTPLKSIKGRDSFDAGEGVYMGLFDGYSLVETISGLDKLDMSEVTNFERMFAYCHQLTDLDLSRWDTSKAISMHSMFLYCSKLESINFSNWNTSNTKIMSSMFSCCGELQSLDLSGFTTSAETSMSLMFYNCCDLQSLTLSDNFNPGVMSSIFYNCGLYSKSVTVYGANDNLYQALVDQNLIWNPEIMHFDGK